MTPIAPHAKEKGSSRSRKSRGGEGVTVTAQTKDGKVATIDMSSTRGLEVSLCCDGTTLHYILPENKTVYNAVALVRWFTRNLSRLTLEQVHNLTLEDLHSACPEAGVILIQREEGGK